MVTRREVLSRGLVGGLVGATVAPDQNLRGQAAGGETDEKIVTALNEMRLEIASLRDTSISHVSAWVTRLRAEMRRHLRSHRRFPGYFEVGYEVWLSVYDWHVATRQPLNVSQLAAGRYTLRLMQTTLVLRHDVEDDYVSEPFDTLEGEAAPEPDGGVRP